MGVQREEEASKAQNGDETKTPKPETHKPEVVTLTRTRVKLFGSQMGRAFGHTLPRQVSDTIVLHNNYNPSMEKCGDVFVSDWF